MQKGLIKWVLSAYENKPHPSDGDLTPTRDLPNHTGPPPSVKREVPQTPPADASSVVPGPPATSTDTDALLLEAGIVSPPNTAPSTPRPASAAGTSTPAGTAAPASTLPPKTPKSKKEETEETKAKKRLEATLHLCPPGYVPETVYPLGETDAMSIEVLKSRLRGTKIK